MLDGYHRNRTTTDKGVKDNATFRATSLDADFRYLWRECCEVGYNILLIGKKFNLDLVEEN
jgi:hypothetical protein